MHPPCAPTDGFHRDQTWAATGRDPRRGRHPAHRRRRRRHRRHRAATHEDPRGDLRRTPAVPRASTRPTAARAIDAPGVQPDYFVAITTVPDAAVPGGQAADLPGARTGLPQLDRSGSRRRRSSRRTSSAPPDRSRRRSSTSSARRTTRPSRVGRSGLERAYERRLAGTPSLQIELVDGNGAVQASLQTLPGTPPAAGAHHPGPRHPTTGRSRARDHRARRRSSRSALRRRGARGREHAGHRGVRSRARRLLSAGLDVQGRDRHRTPPQRRHPRHAGHVPGHHHGERTRVPQLRG